VRGHRIADEDQVDAVIYVASGVGAVDAARDRPGARELAYHDPRTAAQADRYDRLRAAVIDGLEQAGLDDLVPQVDRDLIALGGHTRLPPELRPSIDAMWQMPQPVGVYTWDPER
jgi:hypothetical protein